jgi:tRNA/rRNA methyltransferase
MINVVLVEPGGEENVGSVSRAMMNMNVSNLILVNPRCNHLSEKSLNFAVHSKKILENAVIKPSLYGALSGTDLGIAVTRRTGNWRKRDLFLNQLPDFLSGYKNKKIHLVFGREANGLTNEEIDSCDLICSIPSSDEFPSINLSHSVILVLYEIFSRPGLKKEIKNAEKAGFDAMIESIYSAFHEMNFFKENEQKILKKYIRKILLRAGLDDFDTGYINKIFQNIKGIMNNK